MDKQNNDTVKEQKKKKLKPKYKKLNPNKWGIDFNKNEYQEIVLSNSNHPELM